MRPQWAVIVLVLVATACGSSGSARRATSAASPASGAGVRGVVAIGSAKQKVRADLAFVVFEPNSASSSGGSFGFPGSPPTTNARSSPRADLLARLRALGLPETALHMDATDEAQPFGDSGPSSVRVEVPIAKLPNIATDVSKAIDAVMHTTDVAGLRFAVENCTAALTSARRDAVNDAHDRARALAAAAHVTLGDLRDVSEGPNDPISAAYFASLGNGQPCGRSWIESLSIFSGYNSPPEPLDAKPEVELTFSVSATFALGDDVERTLTATGLGEVSGKADRAELLVSPSPLEESSDGPTIVAGEREQLTRAVTALGVKPADLEIELRGERLLYVSAKVPIDVLTNSGTKIVDAVKAVAGDQVLGRVLFASSACNELVAQARSRAITDADARLTALAHAAKLRTGAIVGIVEPNVTTSPIASASPDPCDTDIESFASIAGLGGLVSGTSGPGEPKLEALDAEPKVTRQVSVTIVRALTG